MVLWKHAWPALVVGAAPFMPAWAAPDNPAPEQVRSWREQMERVGEFPHGHADIVRWERQHLPSGASEAPPDPPLPVDEAVRLAFDLHPDLITVASPDPLADRERHLTQVVLAARVRQAWLDAVLAGEVLRLQQARAEVADAGAELARRMVKAGNWSAARALQEQITQANERVALLQSRQAERTTREALARLIGVADAPAVAAFARRLPAQIPALPASATAPEPADPEAAVLQADPALAQQRISTQRLMASVSGERLARAGQVRAQALTALDPQGWPTTRIDLTDPRLARDPALADAAEAQASLQRHTAERRSQAREAWGRVQDQYAEAQQAQTVLLPLVIQQEEETQLRYNGMLQSTWELMEATRERLAVTRAAAEARHGYWTALLDWQRLSAGVTDKDH